MKTMISDSSAVSRVAGRVGRTALPSGKVLLGWTALSEIIDSIGTRHTFGPMQVIHELRNICIVGLDERCSAVLVLSDSL